MNPYQIPTQCEVCGGDGMATMKDATQMWRPLRNRWGRISTMRHSDPDVCRQNLERKSRDLKITKTEAIW